MLSCLFRDSNIENRAQSVVLNCTRLGMKTSHCSGDFLIGNVQMNCVFLSQMFLSNPGLETHLDSAEDVIEGDVENDEGSREERTFR